MEDVVDGVDDEWEARDARNVDRRLGSTAGGHRGAERRPLDPSAPVRRPHHRDVGPDIVQPELVYPFALSGGLALQLQAKFDEVRNGSREILDHDAGVIPSV
jgi:hypothetical protein